ncbi:MAG: class I SAM-dependent RNA methyltransferase, partial [Oscillospiraceae bacterium]
QGVKAIELEDFVGKNDAFPVKGYSLNSALHSIPDCQSIIKKACVERLKSKYNISWFEETGALFQLQFSILKDMVTINIDTTGAGLHKRGYRKNANEAPIKETLAAGIIDLARIRQDSIVCDPFCGSGTFLIESAFKALDVAPGMRRKFTAESWRIIPDEVWKNARKDAVSAVNKQGSFHAYGSDIDPDSVDLSRENAGKAGVSSKISLLCENVKSFAPPENSITICNPPYGERMLELKQAEELYSIMGQVFCPSASNPCYIISPHEDFERFFGKKADKRRKLYNGMIKCQLFMYFK